MTTELLFVVSAVAVVCIPLAYLEGIADGREQQRREDHRSLVYWQRVAWNWRKIAQDKDSRE